jgi:hypothetical protein
MAGSVTVLSNGNYVVSTPAWDDGAATNVGAVTWGSGTTGVSGVVSAYNSLIGGTAGDGIGIYITVLVNGNYVVSSPFWDNGAATNAGAVTWVNGTMSVSGVVSAANSLVGSTADDRVGATEHNGNGVRALPNGNFVIRSPQWDNGAAENAGAVTWGNGTTGVSGLVSAANSLVGSTRFDLVGGEAEITVLANGNYVVSSPFWDHGAAEDAGAVTWGSGTTGLSGLVSALNSLVGTTTFDNVGHPSFGAGVTALANGNYVVWTRFWNNGTAFDVGAVTWGSGTIGVTGPINAFNSAVGLENIGFGAPTFLSDNTNDTIIVRFAEGRVLVGSQTVGFTAVRAGSASWDADFTDFVDPVLDLGYIIPPDAAPLPWTNLNRVSVTFTNAIEKAGGGTLTADDFDLVGVNQADYNTLVTGFSYNAATRTATFTFSQAIPADKLLVHIDAGGVQDAAGHVQLGQYDFRFDVLPGDADRTGAVLGSDVGQVRLKQFAQLMDANYSIFHDIDGSGAILGNDVGLARLRQFDQLPDGEPMAPAAAAALSAAAFERAFDDWAPPPRDRWPRDRDEPDDDIPPLQLDDSDTRLSALKRQELSLTNWLDAMTSRVKGNQR